jgi:hypothetical protein
MHVGTRSIMSEHLPSERSQLMKALLTLTLVCLGLTTWGQERLKLPAPMTNHQVNVSFGDRSSKTDREAVLVVHKDIFVWTFTHPAQRILVLTESMNRGTYEQTDNDFVVVENERLTQAITGTGLTYEDLSLAFLRWPNPQYLGREGKDWRVRLTAPDARGDYGTVDLWITTEHSLVREAQVWNRNGYLIRHFKVRSAHTDDFPTMPKALRVDFYSPETKEVVNRTYVEFGSPVKRFSHMLPPLNGHSMQANPATGMNMPEAATRQVASSAPSPTSPSESISLSEPPHAYSTPELSKPSHSLTTALLEPVSPMALTSQLPNEPTDTWSKVVATLERQSGIMIAVLAIMIGLIICASYLAGWVRGAAAR